MDARRTGAFIAELRNLRDFNLFMKTPNINLTSIRNC